MRRSSYASNPRVRIYFLAISLLAAVSIGVNILYRSEVIFAEGLGVDEGEFLFIGDRIAQAGVVPYRDLFDHKPPALYALIAAVVAIGGDNIFAPRWSLAILTILSGIALGRFAAIEFRSLLVGSVACILYLFEFSILRFGSLAYTDSLAIALGIIGLAICFEPCLKRSGAPIAGVLFGLSFLSKQTGILYLITALALLLWEMAEVSAVRSNISAKLQVKKVMWVLFGFMLVNLVTILLFYWQRALSAYIEQAFLFNLEYSYPYNFVQRNAQALITLMKATPWIWIGMIATVCIFIFSSRWALILCGVTGLGIYGFSLVLTLASISNGANLDFPGWTRWFVGWKLPLIIATLMSGVLLLLGVSHKGFPQLTIPRRLMRCVLWFLIAWFTMILPGTYLGGGTPIGSHALLPIAPASVMGAVGLMQVSQVYLLSNRSSALAAILPIIVTTIAVVEPAVHRLYAGSSLQQQNAQAALIRSMIPEGKSMYSYPYSSGYYLLVRRYPPLGVRYTYLTPPIWMAMERYSNIRDEVTNSVARADYVVDWRDSVEHNYRKFPHVMEQLYGHIRLTRPLIASTRDFDLYGPRRPR
jgi:4-amino-4-deoxy-L-arabinose transferase-like glycosyltransferase